MKEEVSILAAKVKDQRDQLNQLLLNKAPDGPLAKATEEQRRYARLAKESLDNASKAL